MIKTVVTCTYEMVDANMAIEEILQQLDLEKTQLTHAAGIIICFPIHIEMGIVKALSEALPFDIVGSVTLGNAVKDMYGSIMPMLTLTMLTSDEVAFATACTSRLEHLETKQILDITSINEAQENKNLTMVMPFIPLSEEINPTVALNCLQKDINKDVSFFGMVACDPMESTLGSVIYRGQAMNDAMPMLLIYGDMNPTFFVTSIPDKNIQKQKAVITKSEGHILKEVNNMPILQYLKTLGLSQDDSFAGFSAFPFVINYNKGTEPILRAIKQISPEGYAICAGDMPLHATLSFTSFEAKDVLETVELLAEKIKATGKTNGLWIISCAARNYVLENNSTLELEKFYTVLGDTVPYVGCYSTGEICPLYDTIGKPINYFHNYSVVACVF